MDYYIHINNFLVCVSQPFSYVKYVWEMEYHIINVCNNPICNCTYINAIPSWSPASTRYSDSRFEWNYNGDRLEIEVIVH